MKFLVDWKRVAVCFGGVLGMGFFLSFLILCSLGTDPCTFMNRSIAVRLGLSFGNLQLMVNALLLIVVILFKRELLGIGTIFNMVLVGYYADFFDWLWGKTIPSAAFTMPVSRFLIFFITLAFFIVSAAIYINSQTGVAPYDAVPMILIEKLTGRFPRLPGALVRMLWDAAAILIGMLFGGVPVIGIILMALFLGPVISFVGRFFHRSAGESNYDKAF